MQFYEVIAILATMNIMQVEIKLKNKGCTGAKKARTLLPLGSRSL